MYCENCGVFFEQAANFCRVCGKDVKTISLKTNESAESVNSEYPGKKLQSFDTFRSLKSKQWSQKVHSNKQKKQKEDVVINIGLMHISDSKLKPKRGKRVALRVSTDDTYHDILEKAVEKWSAYHSDCYCEDGNYMLVFDNCTEASAMPGTSKPFNLKEYQQETGKDFKRIVLYLCSKEDRDFVDDEELPQFSNYPNEKFEFEEPPFKKRFSSDQIQADEMFAKNLQKYFLAQDKESCSGERSSNVSPTVKENGDDIAETPLVESVSSVSELIDVLTARIDDKDQFFLVIRRGATLKRQLAIWDRQSKKKSPTMKLMVHFAGDEGIDTGAIHKECLSNIISDISREMFPNGGPVDSMLSVHNGCFRMCGEIVVVSLVNGGPPPCFLDESVYQMLVDPQSVDIQNLNISKHLTSSEIEFIKEIEKEPAHYKDFIIDNGYTGVISHSNLSDIIGTMLISIVTNRMIYLKEFFLGLELLGFGSILKNNVELLKELFVVTDNSVDANFVVSALTANFSAAGSKRRKGEELIIDYFQDMLFSLEDGKVSGQSEPLAYLHGNEGIEGSIESEDDKVAFETTPDLSPCGIFKWLTGQRHKSLNGEKVEITVDFDHECLNRNPNHKICFPIVGACGKNILLPVSHMISSTEEFQRIFLLAFCKGQVFSRR